MQNQLSFHQNLFIMQEQNEYLNNQSDPKADYGQLSTFSSVVYQDPMSSDMQIKQESPLQGSNKITDSFYPFSPKNTLDRDDLEMG